MKKIAYLIVAHTNPLQLSRLIERLSDDNVIFSVHISLTATPDFEVFKTQINSLVPQATVHFIDRRFKGTWGSFNLVKIAVELIRSVLQFKPEHLILISGQDYPIKSRNKFYSFLSQNTDKILMPFKLADWPANKTNRINRYYFPEYFKYGTSVKPTFLTRLITKILPGREFLKDMQPYTGRYWCVLPNDVAQFLVSEYDSNKKLNRFFKTVLLPEEQFFHTILMNSKFAERMCNFSVSFSDYSKPRTPVWQKHDIDLLKKQQSLFARKFDPNVDEEILDLIDKQILEIN